MIRFGSAGIRRVRSAFVSFVLATFVAAAIPGHADEPGDGPAPGPAAGEVSRPSGKGPARTTGPIERPYYFEPTPQGWPGETRDARDIAPYMAFHKARIAERINLMATTPTSNQSKWDARFYDIDVDLNPSLSRVTGTVIIKATVTNGPLTTLDLDFKANLSLTEVRSAGIVVTSSRNVDVLTVNLDRSYANGELVTVQVKYFGTPTGGYFNFNTSGGQPMIWSLSEPFGARTWWPCKDYSDDKADSVDIQVRVPSNLITASNGTRIVNTSGGGFATTKWKERYPIATYLVFVASHPYTVATDWYVTALGDSVPLTFWMFPGSVATATPNNALVNDMMTAFAPLFGEYPFANEKYGHAQFLFGGGMEHQTCTCLGVYIESITAHELAHQWWGDKVTCATFNHIWLNEGFASYGEALWAEANGGAAARKAEMGLAKYFGAGTVYVPDLSDENRIFDSNLSYNKGSWVAHMLRGVVGDDDFFDGLQAYNTQYAYASATTENLRDAMEAQSGMDLDRFFQQWVYGEYYPEYDYDWSVVPAGGGYDVHLTIDQTQSWQLFKMPITMRVSTAGGDIDFTVNDSLATQSFVLHTALQPTDVALDPDEWILKSVVIPLGTPTFDRSILVVNGVDWVTYGTEITNAYAAEAFWGDYNI
ncbi:MAG TPA: M1 family metallopeptidase, partial [Candidatus Eisenbacteria bacterium]